MKDCHVDLQWQILANEVNRWHLWSHLTLCFKTGYWYTIEDYEGWWSSAEHWWLKPGVFWVQIPVAAGLFTFLYFRLVHLNSYIGVAIGSASLLELDSKYK